MSSLINKQDFAFWAQQMPDADLKASQAIIFDELLRRENNQEKAGSIRKIPDSLDTRHARAVPRFTENYRDHAEGTDPVDGTKDWEKIQQDVNYNGLAGQAGTTTQPLHTFKDGAQVSEVMPRYDLMLRSVIDAYARRLGRGAIKYGDNNYLKSLSDPKYIRERMNHLYHHVLALMNIGEHDKESPQQNLDAVLWNAGFLCEVLSTEQGQKLFYEIVVKPNYFKS